MGWGLGLVRLRLAAVSAPQLSLTFITSNKHKTFNHHRFDRALGYARQLSSWGTILLTNCSLGVWFSFRMLSAYYERSWVQFPQRPVFFRVFFVFQFFLLCWCHVRVRRGGFFFWLRLSRFCGSAFSREPLSFTQGQRFLTTSHPAIKHHHDHEIMS